MTWCERQRMEWITETLRVFGFINRRHLRRKFGISQPQARNDLRTYLAMHPGAMRYDPHGKRYVSSAMQEQGGTRIGEGGNLKEGG